MKKWIYNNLDKVAHFTICVILIFIFDILFKFTIIAPFISFIFVIIIGVLKEIYDFKNGGIFDKNDLLADILGAIFGTILISLL